LTISKHICYTNVIREQIGVGIMAVGDRIKRIRNLRGLTQKELGVAVGFEEKTADVRIAQYESGTRTPKEDMLQKIAEALDVNYRSIYEPTLYAAEDIMYTLFELDEHYPIRLHEIIDDSDPDFTEKHIAVNFHTRLLDEFLTEWMLRKQQLKSGKITREEYMEWKINWPQTADDCGKFEPKKQWRKDK
jgi:transcriptional regulator with XRE-family HTH domain